MIAGFTALNRTAKGSIARFNADGSLDNTFSANVSDEIDSMAIQPDGKVLIGGTFSSIGGINQKGIARLNSDGSLDTSFNVGTGTSEGDEVEDFVVQPNGKIVLSGLITSVNGTPRRNVARLNANGSLDTTI